MFVYSHGRLVERYVDKNLIVDTGVLQVAKLLGGDVTDRSITQIGFGTNGATPTRDDTALTGPHLRAFTSISYPATNEVQFNWELPTTAANGMAILEFGLITAGGALFSRKTRTSAINKTSYISATGSWLLRF